MRFVLKVLQRFYSGSMELLYGREGLLLVEPRPAKLSLLSLIDP